MIRRILSLLLSASLLLAPVRSALAEERAPSNHAGVPLMASGAALFTIPFAISYAVGLTTTIEWTARCSKSGPRPLGEAIDCLSPPSEVHLMMPVAGPFRALAAEPHDTFDRAVLAADGISQVAGLILAGIGIAQHIDAIEQKRAAAHARVVPRGAGVAVVGTF